MRIRRELPEQWPGLLRWSEGRKVRWFFSERFFPRVVDAVGTLMCEKNYYSALHMMLLGIEILSGFFAGRKPGADTFCEFTGFYFNRLLQRRVRNPVKGRGVTGGELDGKLQLSLAEILWASLRSGFADACATYPGGSISRGSHYYCRFYSRVGMRLDIHKFHRDFLAACQRYYADAYGDYLVRQRFVRRFNELFGAAGGSRRAGGGGATQ